MSSILNQCDFVNQLNDIKAFKGKGELRAWLRSYESRIQEVQATMRALHFETKNMKPRRFFLEQHTQRERNVIQLRWRMSGSGKHMQWVKVQPMLLNYPVGLQQWYAGINQDAIFLNGLQRMLHNQAKALSQFILEIDNISGHGVAGNLPVGLPTSVIDADRTADVFLSGQH